MSKRSRASRDRQSARHNADQRPPDAHEGERPAAKTTRARDRPVRAQPQRAPRVRGGMLRALALPGILGAAMVAVAVVALTAPGAPAAGTATNAPRPVLGDASAAVEIHEYGDFQCPSCGAFSRNIRPSIVEAYVETGKARIIWHDFAWIGPESRAAANAARCAGDQDRFWEYHDILYVNQAGENQGAFGTDKLKGFGEALGLDSASFDACVDGGTYSAAVQADFADVRSLGLTGTPSFIIGGQRIVGAQRFEVFQAAIEAVLGARGDGGAHAGAVTSADTD